MEAQGQRKETVFCDKCYTVVEKNSEFCPNCGASLSRAPGAEGSDSEVYPLLAKANLLRMRKNYKEAEEVCLSILRRFPHNLSANALLGDISVEENNLSQAAEWYELALDIEPESNTLHEKLDAVKEQIQAEATVTTAEQLGLPTQKPKTWAIVALAIAILALLAVGGYLASRAARNSNRLPQSRIDQPVVLNSDTTGSAPSATTTKTSTDGGNPVTPPGPTEEDQELTKLLATKTTDAEYVLDARYVPAIDGISLTYMVPSDQNERKLGASLASEAFGLVKDNLNRDISEIELRAVRDKKIFYNAIVKKDAYDATQDPAWQSAHQNDQEAFMKAILSGEHYASEDSSDSGGGEGADSTSGGASETTTGSAQSPPSGGNTGSTAGSPSGSSNASGSSASSTGAESGASSPKPASGGSNS